jgi:hypothetical protein
VRSQSIGWIKTEAGRASLRWFALGFTLVLGIVILVLGVALFGPLGGRTGDTEAAAEDAARALMLQRFGEWQLYESPRATAPEAWQLYRAGERAPYSDVQATAVPKAWQLYRAGERASLGEVSPPQGEMEDHAGQLVPR